MTTTVWLTAGAVAGQCRALPPAVSADTLGMFDVAGFEIPAVLADHRHAEREAAPHGLGHRLLDRLLRSARFGPEALQQLAAMLDLDERPGPIVAASPEGHELLARLQRPLGRGHQVRDLDGELSWPRGPARSAAAGR